MNSPVAYGRERSRPLQFAAGSGYALPHALDPGPKPPSVRLPAASGQARSHRGGWSSPDRSACGDERRGDDCTGVSECGDQPMQPVPGRPGFVAEVQSLILAGQPPDQLPHALQRGINFAEIPDLAVSASIRNRDRVP
jgi:hypothetical protein